MSISGKKQIPDISNQNQNVLVPMKTGAKTIMYHRNQKDGLFCANRVKNNLGPRHMVVEMVYEADERMTSVLNLIQIY